LGCGGNTTLLGPRTGGCPPGAKGAWLLVWPASARAPRGAVESVVNGLAVWRVPGKATTVVPALRTSIEAHGAAAARVLQTLGPSGIAVIAATRYPRSVPGGWKRVTYRGIRFAVPAAWAVRPIGRNTLEPGMCGTRAFTKPEVVEGTNHVIPLCPMVWSALARTPADGVWVRPGPGTRHPVLFWSFYAEDGAADLAIVETGRPEVEVGVGRNPAVAEEILSSLGITGGPRSALAVPGRVVGYIDECAGLTTAPPRHVAGTVDVALGIYANLMPTGLTLAEQTVRAGGEYRFVLPPGDYALATPYPGSVYARWVAVTVRAGRTVTADIPNLCK
ncbi:MAG: hypothetical protein ACYCUG_08350, partial [Acidimicrobiales bacterium]